MLPLDLTGKHISAAENVLVRELDGESVLLNLDREAYFGLDAVGTRMWAALVQSPTFDDAVRALADEYEVERTQLVADLGKLVAQLRDAGLVEIHDR